jgi:hypothetical protein
MKSKTKTLTDLSTMKEDAVTLPVESIKSLAQLFWYFQDEAFRTHHDLPWAKEEAAQTSPVFRSDAPAKSASESIDPIDELGMAVVGSILMHVATLKEQVESLNLLVLINDYEGIEPKLRSFVGDFKFPLMQLSFLQQLWQINFAEVKVGELSFAAHLQQFPTLEDELLQMLVSPGNVFEISAHLEQSFAPWLQTTAVFLALLHRNA